MTSAASELGHSSRLQFVTTSFNLCSLPAAPGFGAALDFGTASGFGVVHSVQLSESDFGIASWVEFDATLQNRVSV